MMRVNFYASKLACRRSWRNNTRPHIKINAIKVMIVEAYYKMCGYGKRPKCEYLEL